MAARPLWLATPGRRSAQDLMRKILRDVEMTAEQFEELL